MKKQVVSVILIILFQILLTGCGQTENGGVSGQDGKVKTLPGSGAVNQEETEEAQDVQFEAEVMENGLSLLVTPKEGSSELLSSDKIIVSITDGTIENEEGITISSNELNAGDILMITYNGMIAESYPAQITAKKVERIGHNILLDGYLELIDYIYQQDDALNSGISMIAVETAEWIGLSENQKEIVLNQIKERYQMEVLDTTYDDLVKQGLIDDKNLYFETGIIITIGNMEYTETKGMITCSLKKWRSGLGAVGADAVTAKYDQQDWKIEAESMWIS